MNMGKLAWGLPCILLAWGTAPAEQTLFVNGVVWTADPALPQAEAVLVDGGRIEYVGTAEAAAERAAQDAEVIDLSGGMLLPGFIETHSHPAVAGLLNSKLQVIGTRTTAEVQAALRAYADTHADEEVLFGFGFPSALNTAVNAAGVQGPYREDLDAVVSDRPVMLIALDAHSAWVNSKALEVAGITRETPDPLPGVHYYQRDENGEPTGWMVEGNAFWPLVPLFGIGSEDDFRAAFSAMLPRYAAMGITTVFDAASRRRRAAAQRAPSACGHGGRGAAARTFSRQLLSQQPGRNRRRFGAAPGWNTSGLRLRPHRSAYGEDSQRRHHRRRNRRCPRTLRQRRPRRRAAVRGTLRPVARHPARGRLGRPHPRHRRPHPERHAGSGSRRPPSRSRSGQPRHRRARHAGGARDLARLRALDVASRPRRIGRTISAARSGCIPACSTRSGAPGSCC